VAPIHEIDSDLRRLVDTAYRERGGRGPAIPGVARVAGRGRVDVRFAADNNGELYLLTKADGVIRQVVGASALAVSVAAAGAAPASPSSTSDAPVPPTPQSIAGGKKAYDTYCAACHGSQAQGAVRAGTALSIIAEGNRQPPDLTDAQWDHGSSDRDIYNVIKRGVPTTMMPPFDGGIPDSEIWSIVNYLRSLASTK
jgi:mono/diheme cytochrome c family protein